MITMREIKFRAWSKRFNGMYTEIHLNSDYCIFNKTAIPICDFRSDDVIVMQFTGLCDKAGKPIYEGDIIYYSPKDEDLTSYVKGHYIVNWDNPNCGFYPFSDNIYVEHLENYIGYIPNKECIIVGNIHETKEEQKKEWGIEVKE